MRILFIFVMHFCVIMGAIVLVSCASPITPPKTDAEINLGKRLTGPQIVELISDSTVYGQWAGTNTRSVEYHSPNGQVEVSYYYPDYPELGGKTFSGSWRIRGDIVCYEYYQDNSKVCYELYYGDNEVQFVEVASRQVFIASRIERSSQGSADASQFTSPAEPETGYVKSGTAFFVSEQGHLLTNNHVIDGCSLIAVELAKRSVPVDLLAVDRVRDLALLKFPYPGVGYAPFRTLPPVAPGESVVVVGFPLRGLLAGEANVTTGTVSALAGIGNDARMMQITAPVQSGNSGGPLLDETGRVIGVVVAKLDDTAMLELTGEIPQNVNFAIKGVVVISFLNEQNIPYSARDAARVLRPAEIGQTAKKFTVPVDCWN